MEKTGRGLLFLIAVAAALLTTGVSQTPAGDPSLNHDPRFTSARPQAESGTGQDDGTYLPPIAGPMSEIVGTVQSEAAGPTAFYVGTVDNKGNKQFWRGVTDALGRFHLKVPQVAAGVASLVLFKHFDKNGKPDEGALCQITDKVTHLSGTEAVLNAPVNGPAIVEASTSYERGGLSQGVFRMQTRGTNPLASRATLDGSDSNVDTLAVSDRSFVGKVRDDTRLGPHRFGIRSGDQRTNDQPAYVVALRFDPLPPMHANAVVPVRLHVEGLERTPGNVVFTVTGGAEVAGGGETQTVPVVNGVAECPIHAKHPGPFKVDVLVLVALADVLAKLPPLGGPADGAGGEQPGGPKFNKTEPPPPPTETPVGVAPPSPAAYGAATCEPKVAGGWMEPSQGVWQDDNVFDDHPTKQLTRLNDDGEPPAYKAEMDMVTERDTRLFGIHHYRFKGARWPGGYHGVIVMGGTSDCSDPPKPVSMRFSVESGNQGQVIYTSGVVGQIPLTGHRVAEKPWQVELRSDDGIPPWPRPAYRFTAAGPYTFRDELIADTGPTGLAMAVGGNAHPVVTLKVGFLAAFLKTRPESERAVIEQSERLARESAKFIPDFYPLHTGGWISGNQPWLDLTTSPAASATYEPSPFGPRDPKLQADLDQLKQRTELQAELGRRLDALARLTGYDRFVVILHQDDMAFMAEGAGGLAFSQKVVFVSDDQTHMTVAHEIAHTLPYLWTDQQMKAQCSQPGDYHNSYDRLAYGVRLDKAGVDNQPDFQERKYSVMGPVISPPYQWIDQCTFWHLADELKKKPDPAVLLIRGVAIKLQGNLSATLWPAYDLTGSVDLSARAPRPGEEWAIVLRDRNSQRIASYPFEPQWKDENGKPRNLTTFSYQIPAPSNLGSIELHGPGGLLIIHRANATAPVVRITAPAAGASPSGGKVHVRWSIAAGPQTQPLSTVLYSTDGGTTYEPRMFEESATSLDVSLDPHASKHRVKVIVTDGTRSGEVVVDFQTAPR